MPSIGVRESTRLLKVVAVRRFSEAI